MKAITIHGLRNRVGRAQGTGQGAGASVNAMVKAILEQSIGVSVPANSHTAKNSKSSAACGDEKEYEEFRQANL